MSRILLTGATGFIGRAVLSELVGSDREVHATHKGPHPDIAGVTWHSADLLAPQGPQSLIERVQPKELIHVAWYTEHGAFWNSERNLDWIAASLNLVRAFYSCGGERFLGVGSGAEYEWAGSLCDETTTRLRPSSLYGAAKAAVALTGERYAAIVGGSWAWARVFWLYGPGENPNRLVPSLCRSLIKGEPARCSPGTQVRDFLHVQDVASALAAILRSKSEGSINIGSDHPVSIAEIATTLGELAGRPDLIQLGALPANANEPALVAPKTLRLIEEVGWSQKFTLREGLCRTLEWCKTEAF